MWGIDLEASFKDLWGGISCLAYFFLTDDDMKQAALSRSNYFREGAGFACSHAWFQEIRKSFHATGRWFLSVIKLLGNF